MTQKTARKANAVALSILFVALAFNAMIWFGSRGSVARFRNAGKPSVPEKVPDFVTLKPKDSVKVAKADAPYAGGPFELAGMIEMMTATAGVSVEAFEWAGLKKTRKWTGGPDYVITIAGRENSIMDLLTRIEKVSPGLCLTAVRLAESDAAAEDDRAKTSADESFHWCRISAAFDEDGPRRGGLETGGL